MDWNKDAVAQLKEQFAGYVVSGYPIGMAIEIYPKYQYRQDLTNRAESIMDTLVDAGILADDDIAHVDSLSISFCEYDKANPRAVVYLDE